MSFDALKYEYVVDITLFKCPPKVIKYFTYFAETFTTKKHYDDKQFGYKFVDVKYNIINEKDTKKLSA